MPNKENHEEIGHRRTRTDNQYFMGLFEWGSTPRETEIAAEEYLFFRGELDLTEAHDHKDDRWRKFKQRNLAKEGKESEGKVDYTGDEFFDSVEPAEDYVKRK
ncbi:MAG TPA: hypothetical protein GX735_08030 [Firmicutes bacterium]|jgi:hypothetical protein|nr:hypothetical protein [Bacillota bacterium]